MNTARKYTPLVIETIIANKNLPRKELAELIGVGVAGMKKEIWKLKKEGHDIPHNRERPIGTKVMRMDGNKLREFVKNKEGKWRRVPYEKQQRSQAKRGKDVKPRKTISTAKRQIKPEPKVFKKRIEDMTKMHYVRKDKRTWALRPINQVV